MLNGNIEGSGNIPKRCNDTSDCNSGIKALVISDNGFLRYLLSSITVTLLVDCNLFANSFADTKSVSDIMTSESDDELINAI